MYIIWFVEPLLVLKNIPSHKGNEISIETIPTNNNQFFIGSIFFNIWFVEPLLVLKNIPSHKGNEISIETIPTNNNQFFIGSICFNAIFFTYIA